MTEILTRLRAAYDAFIQNPHAEHNNAEWPTILDDLLPADQLLSQDSIEDAKRMGKDTLDEMLLLAYQYGRLSALSESHILANQAKSQTTAIINELKDVGNKGDGSKSDSGGSIHH